MLLGQIKLYRCFNCSILDSTIEIKLLNLQKPDNVDLHYAFFMQRKPVPWFSYAISYLRVSNMHYVLSGGLKNLTLSIMLAWWLTIDSLCRGINRGLRSEQRAQAHLTKECKNFYNTTSFWAWSTNLLTKVCNQVRAC